MKKWFARMWREEDGVLSFEWTLLASLLTVGAVSGIAAVRDATIDEMGDLSQAMLSLDQSYSIQAPLIIGVHSWGFGSQGFGGGGFGGFGGTSAAASSVFIDASSYTDCGRGSTRVQEFPRLNVPGVIDEREVRPAPIEPLAQ